MGTKIRVFRIILWSGIGISLFGGGVLFRESRYWDHAWAVLHLTISGGGGPFVRTTTPPDPPQVIAHAGGKLRQMLWTNSREALDINYTKGYRWFEIDLNETTDGHWVAIHDWDFRMRKIFGKEECPLSLASVRSLPKMENFTIMDISELVDWFRLHPDCFLITDIKEKNVKGLQELASRMGDRIDRVVPQIYSFQEYRRVWELGFQNIILTLYRNHYPDRWILRFAAHHPLYGVTMEEGRSWRTTLAASLAKYGTAVFVHPINDRMCYNTLRRKGIAGAYTFYLLPDTVQ